MPTPSRRDAATLDFLTHVTPNTRPSSDPTPAIHRIENARDQKATGLAVRLAWKYRLWRLDGGDCEGPLSASTFGSYNGDSVDNPSRRVRASRGTRLCPAHSCKLVHLGEQMPSTERSSKSPWPTRCEGIELNVATGSRRRALVTGALAVGATRPAARPTLAIGQFLSSPAYAAFAGDILFRILDPTDELIPRQRSDVLPRLEGHGVGDQRVAKVLRKSVHDPTGHSRRVHGATVVRSRTAHEERFRGPLSIRDETWSGRPGSNRRPRPWQGRALPTELRPRGHP